MYFIYLSVADLFRFKKRNRGNRILITVTGRFKQIMIIVIRYRPRQKYILVYVVCPKSKCTDFPMYEGNVAPC